MSKFKIIGKHKDMVGCKDCVLTESVKDDIVRFTATINGFRNWKIYEGCFYDGLIEKVIKRISEIKSKIDNGDEKVFYNNQLIMAICPICGKDMRCLHCQVKKSGSMGVKKRFAGKTKKQISDMMKKVSDARKKV